MSKWQDWGFPNNIYYARPYYVISGLRNALIERIGGKWNGQEMLLNSDYNYIKERPATIVDELIFEALSYTDIDSTYNHLLIIHGQKYLSTTTIPYPSDATKAIDSICVRLGFLDKPFEPFAAPKYSVKWALSRYKLINSITRRNMSGLLLVTRVNRYTKYEGLVGTDVWEDTAKYGLKDNYISGNDASCIAKCTLTDRLPNTQHDKINAPMDITGAFITYWNNGLIAGNDYDSFNSGMKIGDALFFTAEGFKEGSEFDIIPEGFFSIPAGWPSIVAQSLCFHKMQYETEIDQEYLEARDIYLIGDMTPYLEYYDEYGDQEVPPIPEIPDFPEPPGGGGGGEGDDDDDDDDDKPDNPNDPYPDLDLNAYVVVCRHVLEGDKKEIVERQYAVIRYGYVSSRLPAEYKHIVWYPLYTERIYQQPPDYPVYQYEYCFIKTDLGYKDNLELLELWAKTNLEPKGYMRTYF